jgi:hypothetical protein
MSLDISILDIGVVTFCITPSDAANLWRAIRMIFVACGRRAPH